MNRKLICKSAVYGAFCLVLTTGAYAGVRVQYQGPEGVRETVILSGTTHASTTLPGALALPGAVAVTPTLVPLAEVGGVVSGTVTQGGNGVAVSLTEVQAVERQLVRSGTSRAACLKSLALLGEMAALGGATGSDDGAAYMQVVAASAILQGQVEAGSAGDWGPVGKALAKVPRGSDLHEQLTQAGDYAKALCRPDNTDPEAAKVSWPR